MIPIVASTFALFALIANLHTLLITEDDPRYWASQFLHFVCVICLLATALIASL